MLIVYPKGHGRGGIVYKRTTDGGLTWSDRLPTPKSWETSREVPTIYRVIDAKGTKRLIMWSGLYPARLAVSENDGQSWSELKSAGDWGGIVVMGCLEPVKTGKGHYMAMFHDDGRFFTSQAKQEKPVVSAFIDGSVHKICALKPDLIIGFSDIQADLARKLIAANQQVLIFNQRSLQEILEVILAIGSLVGRQLEAVQLCDRYLRRLESIQTQNANRYERPRVYFEEWDEPMISGIQWVSELIDIAGGRDIFSDRARGKLAKERFVQAEEVIEAQPDIVFASWCGKPFDSVAFRARPGFDRLPAVQKDQIHEVPSELILQPGPACLTAGLDHLIEGIRTAL